MINETNIVKVIVDGNEIEVSVKRYGDVSELSAMASAIAQSTVTDEGDYNPWMEDIGKFMMVANGYTDFEIPDEWTDTDMLAFYDSQEFYNIVDWIDEDQLKRGFKWIDEMIDVRKSLYFVNPMPGLTALVGAIMNASTANEKADLVDSE